MITVKSKGKFANTTKYFTSLTKKAKPKDLERYGKLGVDALKANTPVDTGLTRDSWTYKIEESNGKYKLVFLNTNIQNGVPIAIILQYGHATRNGAWIEGRDYINPAIQPVFDQIAKDAWKEVTSL